MWAVNGNPRRRRVIWAIFSEPILAVYLVDGVEGNQCISLSLAQRAQSGLKLTIFNTSAASRPVMTMKMCSFNGSPLN